MCSSKPEEVGHDHNVHTKRPERELPLEEPSLTQPNDPLESRSEGDSDFDLDTTLSGDQKQRMSEEFIQEWVDVTRYSRLSP